MISPCTDTIPMENAQITFFAPNTSNSTNSTIYIYGISDECHDCLHLPLSLNHLLEYQICLFIDTTHPFSIGYSSEPPFSGCPERESTCPWQPSTWMIAPESYHYDEYAHYQIHIEHIEHSDTNNSKHHLSKQTKAHRVIVQSASDKHIPLYIAIATILTVIIIYNLYRIYKTKWTEKYGSIGIHSGYVSNIKDPGPRSQRVVSLDAFRGMALIIMIFVNSGGGGYWWLNHSTWNGLTVADLVFPWFIFIMGTAMAITFPRKLARLRKVGNSKNFAHHQNAVNVVPERLSTLTRWTLTKTTLVRGAKLFLIGILIINHAFDLKHIRIPGVLQYFAVSYTINSLLLIWLEPVYHEIEPKCSNLYVPEVILYWKQWLFVLVMLAVDLILIFVPDIVIYGDHCGAGYMGPGGIG